MQVIDFSCRIDFSCKAPEDTRVFLEQEAEETGVPLSNLISYITANYVREEKNRRLRKLDKYKWDDEDTQK